jgi:hypothetical protein
MHLYIIQVLVLYPAPLGALTPLWAGTSAEAKDFNGKVAYLALDPPCCA